MKILIEKTENDDRLISMLREEIKRLEQQKGVKSKIPVADSGPISNPDIQKLKN